MKICFLILGVIQAEHQKAIDAGADYLLAHLDKDPGNAAFQGPELIYYALIHAGRHNDPRSVALLETILKTPLNAPAYPVYNISLRIMILSKLDPNRYRLEIAQCAWWLVNAQTDNGQWDYYGPAGPPPESFPEVPWRGGATIATGIKATKGLKIERTEKWAPAPREKIYRNTSTMQYALLGLYSAYQAKILIPEETWRKALENILRYQAADGGWAYIDPADKNNIWQPATHTYAGMTASNLSALAILREMVPTEKGRIDAAGERGFANLASGLRLERPDPKADLSLDYLYFYYGMFSIERAGILWGRETIGKTPWYTVGARDLVRTQAKDGSWGADYSNGSSDKLVNTAFGVLFLRRAVTPIIPTEPGKRKK